MPTRSQKARLEAQAAETALAANVLDPTEDSPPPVPPKRKRAANKTKAADNQPTADDGEAAQQAENAVNRRLANLEAARSCDANQPTPRPVSSTRPTSTLSRSTSRKDITALVAEQRRSVSQPDKDLADGSAGNQPSPANAANPSGTLSEPEETYSDDGDDQSPIKKARTVIVPDPVTPVPPAARKLTAMQKREVEKVRLAAKEAEQAAKEDAAAKKVAEREAKAKAKEDEKIKKKADAKKKKEDEKEGKVKEKQRKKEAKELEKAASKKRAKKPQAQSNQPGDIDKPNSTPTTAVAEGSGTKANAAGKDNSAKGQREGVKGKGKEKGKRKADQSVVTENDKTATKKSNSKLPTKPPTTQKKASGLGKPERAAPEAPLTTSFEFGGLNPTWAASRSRAPTSTRSEPPAKGLKPPVKSAKPASTSVVRPSDLDDEMVLDDNEPVTLKAKNSNRTKNLPPPSKEPSITYIDDESQPQITVESPTIVVRERDDEDNDMDMDTEAGAKAEREYALSPVKKENAEDVLIVDVKVPTKGRKRYQQTDLPSGMNDNEAFRKIVIPTVYWHMGNQVDIWVYGDEWLRGALETICSAIYTSAQMQKVEINGPIFSVAAARLSDWIHKIGAEGVNAVNNYLIRNFDNDDERQKYAEWALKNFNFLWRDNTVTWDKKKNEYKLEEGQKLKGLWLNEVFLQTFGSHFTQISGARKIEALGDPKVFRPIGAAGLCAASVERAYRLWQTRTITKDTASRKSLPPMFTTFLQLSKPTKGVSVKKQQSTQFCHTTCGNHQTDFTESAKQIKDAQWNKIIQAARQFAKDKKNIPSSSEVIMISDDDEPSKFNPRANLVEEDSDEDTKDDKDGNGDKDAGGDEDMDAGEDKDAVGNQDAGGDEDAVGDNDANDDDDGETTDDDDEDTDSDEDADSDENAESDEDAEGA